MEVRHPFPAPPETPLPQWWRIGRATIGFLLDIIAMGRGAGDIIDPLIIGVTLAANVAPIEQDFELSVRYATVDALPPEDLRRPVSVNAVAASLMLPYETVRRRVQRMSENGALVTTSRGVYVPAEIVDNPFFLATAAARYERLRALYFELKALGVLDGLVRPNDVPTYDTPPIRAANRAISEYVLRFVEAVMRHVGDPVSGLIMLEMGRANAENLDAVDMLTEGPIPDARRTPISMLELSRRVGLPAETVRRHVKKLIAAGYCRSVKGGCLAAVERLGVSNAAGFNGLADNLVNLQRLFARCALLGIIARWETEAAA